MGTQRHINRHTGAHIVAQHFDDFPYRFSTASWTLGQFNHDHEPHPRAHDVFWRDKNVEAETAVVRHHKADARIGEITPDYLTGFRYQYTDDTRFAATFTIGAQRLRQHLIAMNTCFHLLAGKIQIVFAAFDT